jgi:hypothetical protein
MSWVGSAMAISAGIGALGSFAAGNTQAAGINAAGNTLRSTEGQIVGINQPYTSAGGTSLNTLMAGLNQGGQFNRAFTPADLVSNLSPGYGFQLAQGDQAIRNADTPSGGALGGAAVKDLMSFNQGLASTAYQQAFNNWNTTNNNIFSRLSQIAGMGLTAAGNETSAIGSLASGVAGSQAAAAGAKAGGIVGATNAIGGAGVPIAGLLSQGGSGVPGSFGEYGNNTGLYAPAGTPLVAGQNVGGD